jgi:hypothetical protein
VTEYGGTKSIVISTRTVMGGKNPFLGIAYIVVGGLCIILGAIFTVAHLIKPRYVPFLITPLQQHNQILTLHQKTRRPHLPLLEH